MAAVASAINDASEDSVEARLRRNDEFGDGTTLDLSYEYLSDTDGVISDDLLDAIHTNTSVRSLQLEGHIICNLTPEDGQRLFDALGRLPNLQSLFIHNFVAPLPLLTSFLQEARQLKNLTLHTAQLAGRNDAEAISLVNSLRQLTCLEKFKFSNGVVAGRLSLDMIMAAVSQIQSLEIVEIELEQGGDLSLPTLEALCRCPQIKELKLWRITFEPQHVVLVANTLKTNTSLKELELGELGYADHTSESYVAMADMLRLNSCLENVELMNFSGFDDEGCIALASAMEENSTLRQLNVRGCDNSIIGSKAAKAIANTFANNTSLKEWSMNSVGIDDEGAAAIAHALKQDNSTLQTMIFQKIVGNTQRAFLAFMGMLQENITLERVYPEATGEIKVQIDFWIGLNQLKLRNLQLNVDAGREEFMDILARNSIHLDRIFYLLLSNPEFIDDE